MQSVYLNPTNGMLSTCGSILKKDESVVSRVLNLLVLRPGNYVRCDGTRAPVQTARQAGRQADTQTGRHVHTAACLWRRRSC